MERSERKRLGALDGIRGIAIGLVMILHAAGDYVPGGAIGVDVFFALSAFLITSLLLKEHATTGRVSFRRFYERRARRLGPALLLWLALVAPVTAIAIGEGGSILSSTMASLLYYGNYAIAYGWAEVGGAYSQIWSLAIEEQFYFVWPLVLLVMARRLRRRGLLIAVGAMASLGLVAQLSLSDTYFLPWGHSAGILGGAALAVALAGDRPRRLVDLLRSPAIPWTAFVAFALTALGIERVPDPLIAYAFAFSGLIACALIGHAVVDRDSLGAKLLENPALMWLGRRSYGLYLYHRTLAILVPALIPGITLKNAGPLVLAISFAVAELSWRLVEEPVLRRRRPEPKARGRRRRVGSGGEASAAP